MRRWVAAALLTLAALVAPPVASGSDVVVQGTTDVRDAGLLDDVIVPGFRAAYPQYTLKYIAVGTGQALTNARAGQGDAVLTHAPTLEAQFVSGGYSYVPFGLSTFFSDYVIPGPRSDHAGVLARADHDAAHAFELIARAGAAGKANFVSRGDNSGTNVKEKQIWALTSVPLNELGEPGTPATSSDASWYHKAGAGQAQTVQVTEQCPFTGGNCYEITDRGTFNRLETNHSITNLKVVAEKNAPNARGGMNLLVNSFHAYAVNPQKNPSVNLPGALAFLTYLSSAGLQNRLSSYPTTHQRAFFADARPAFAITGRLGPLRVTAGQKVRLSGTLRPQLPGAGPLSGVPLTLVYSNALTARPAGHASLTNDRFAFHGAPTRSGPLSVEFPGFHDLSTVLFPVGTLHVRAKVALERPRAGGDTVRLGGSALPSTDRRAARLLLLGRRAGGGRFRLLQTRRLGARGASFHLTAKLGSGTWQLRVEYEDPGRVDRGLSRPVRVSLQGR